MERIEAAVALVRGREFAADDAHVMDLVASSSSSAYDCEYVAVAEALGLPLVTHDRGLFEDFPEPAHSVEAHLGR